MLKWVGIWWVCTLGISLAQNKPEPVDWSLPLVQQGQWEAIGQRLQQQHNDTLQPTLAPYWWSIKAEYCSARNQVSAAYTCLLRAKAGFERLHNDKRLYEVYRRLAQLLIHQNNLRQSPETWLEAYGKWAQKQADSTAWAKYAALKGDYLLIQNKPELSQPIKYWYQKALRLNGTRDLELRSKLLTNLALYYIEDQHDPQTALQLLDQDLPFLKRQRRPNDLMYHYVNRADAHRLLHQYAQAVNWLQKALTLPITENRNTKHAMIYDFLATNEHLMGHDDKAYHHLLIRDSLQALSNEKWQNEQLTALQTRYETQRKALENAQLKVKNRNMWLGLGAVLVLMLGMGSWAWVRLERLRKARLLALADKKAADQALQATLREQEMVAMASLVEGQERERKRLAAELHDHLGNQLAVLRHHVHQGLQAPQSNTVWMQQLEQQLVQLYTEIRQISHVNHQGLLAEQGLVPAIEQLLARCNQVGTTQFVGHFHQMNQRLSPDLALALLRMVQECITNILKHAHAQRADIQCMGTASDISITIDDDGCGFDPEQQLTSGMGLLTLQDRLTPWHGRCRIDSRPGHGTHVYIEVAL